MYGVPHTAFFLVRMKSTLLLPTWNEIEAVRSIYPTIDHSWVDEILVIDGGSTDGTKEYFEERGVRVCLQERPGFGAAMYEGMLHSTGDIVVEFPPDGNSLPEKIPEVITKVKEGYDLVIASRYKDDAVSLDDDRLTGFGNWMFTRIVNVLFRARFTDSLVGFRAYRKQAAETLQLRPEGLSWPCQTSIRFAKAGYKITEIPATELERIGGKRKMQPFRTGLEISRLILRELFDRGDRAGGTLTEE